MIKSYLVSNLSMTRSELFQTYFCTKDLWNFWAAKHLRRVLKLLELETLHVKFLKTHFHVAYITESTQPQIQLRCDVFDINALIHENLTLKSKWGGLFIICKWPHHFDFDVWYLCFATDTSELNLTLGTFSDMGP